MILNILTLLCWQCFSVAHETFSFDFFCRKDVVIHCKHTNKTTTVKANESSKDEYEIPWEEDQPLEVTYLSWTMQYYDGDEVNLRTDPNGMHCSTHTEQFTFSRACLL